MLEDVLESFVQTIETLCGGSPIPNFLTPSEGQKVIDAANPGKWSDWSYPTTPDGQHEDTENAYNTKEQKIDCSHFVWQAYVCAGFMYDYEIPNKYAYGDTSDFFNGKQTNFTEVTGQQPQVGDVVVMPGHMGIYNPNPPDGISPDHWLLNMNFSGVRYNSITNFKNWKQAKWFRYVKNIVCQNNYVCAVR